MLPDQVTAAITELAHSVAAIQSYLAGMQQPPPLP
jgi:hypothetical protein